MSRAPHEFPRRVLALATGMTPQVVTETLYALAVAGEPRFVPTEVHVITTSEGAQRARLLLLEPRVEAFHALCREYGLAGAIRFDADCIHTIDATSGPLSDIRTPEENALAADAITRFVRGFCADPEAAVHVSIAGGRKSMGYYMGYALSLFGRPQDRLTHVLVSDPFESNRDFFYPPNPPRVLYGKDDRPLDTRDARIELAEIPFVRLRDGLPTELLAGDASFVDTVARATQSIAPPTLAIDLSARSVVAGGRTVRLAPQLLAWYALFAEARRADLAGPGALEPRRVDAERLLKLYDRTAPRLSAGHENLTAAVDADGITEALVRQKVSKINRALKEQLGLAATPYLVSPSGKRPHTAYGLRLPGTAIEVAG